VTAGGTSLHHLDVAANPGPGMLNRLTRSRIIWLYRLEEVKYVLRTGRSPQGKEMVVRICEGPAAPDRDKTRVSDLRQNHDHVPFARVHPGAGSACAGTGRGDWAH
jgi:hypothetical protein